MILKFTLDPSLKVRKFLDNLLQIVFSPVLTHHSIVIMWPHSSTKYNNTVGVSGAFTTLQVYLVTTRLPSLLVNLFLLLY